MHLGTLPTRNTKLYLKHLSVCIKILVTLLRFGDIAAFCLNILVVVDPNLLKLTALLV